MNMNTASGYGGLGSQLIVTDSAISKINTDYYCDSPLAKMANWTISDSPELRKGGYVHYETSLGLESDEVCGDINGNITLLSQSFSSDKLTLCGEDKFSFKRNKLEAVRYNDRLNDLDTCLTKELKHRLDLKTVNFGMFKLIGSAHALSRGLDAIGIAQTPGIASGLGDINNPIKVDISSSRSGGNLLQPNSIDTPTLIDRLQQNMFEQGVLCSTDKIMVSGGGKLSSGFSKDKMCQSECKLINTGMNYNVTPWMPSGTNANGDRISYVVMHDPMDFWFQVHTMYLEWLNKGHDMELCGAYIWGAKVNRPKSVSVAVVQYI